MQTSASLLPACDFPGLVASLSVPPFPAGPDVSPTDDESAAADRISLAPDALSRPAPADTPDDTGALRRRTEQVQQLVDGILYEGHLLHPARTSAPSHGQRFAFGRVYPEAFAQTRHGAEPSCLQVQCLFRPGEDSAALEITVRFLQPLARDIATLREPLPAWPAAGEPALERVPVFELDGALFQSWQEATEREVRLGLRGGLPAMEVPFTFPASRTLEPIRDARGQTVAVIVRHQPALRGLIEVSTEPVQAGLSRLTLRIANHSDVSEFADPDAVASRTFASTHAVIQASGTTLVSLTDPPPAHAAAAAACWNLGLWPVLVGGDATGEGPTLLVAPIILPDYPQSGEDAGES